MSDTPRTDAGARHVSVDRAGCIVLWHSKTGGFVERALSEQLERENDALRDDKERMDWLEQLHGDTPIYLDGEWHCFAGAFETFRAAIDAARAKDGQRCQCTNGVIRSVGRDNDEAIEDCPNCSGSKEAKP